MLSNDTHSINTKKMRSVNTKVLKMEVLVQEFD